MKKGPLRVDGIDHLAPFSPLLHLLSVDGYFGGVKYLGPVLLIQSIVGRDDSAVCLHSQRRQALSIRHHGDQPGRVQQEGAER